MNKDNTPFDFKRLPKRPTILMTMAKRILSFPDLNKRGFTWEKIDMEDLKPPYLLLSTHGSMVDFNIMLKMTDPYQVNNVMTLEGFHDYTEFVMRNLEVLGKRKFIKDLYLLRNIRYCLEELHTIFVLYPEARYSLDGTTSFLPDSLAKMCKMMKVPVVVLSQQGNFISCPQWNKINKNNAVHAIMTQIVNQDEIKKLSVSEIDKRIRKAFIYDDFKYQKDNRIVIDHPDRAEGLHAILYQCSDCRTEFKMHSKGSMLWCEHCQKAWRMTEYGELQAVEGSTRFTHIPDWFAWERENVRNEIEQGTYSFSDEVRIDTLPNAKGFIHQPNGTLTQDMDGTTIAGTIYGKKMIVHKSPLELDSMHVEYDYKKKGDCVDISVADDSYWCYPVHERDVISKLSIATEELYLFQKRQAKKEKNLKIQVAE